MIRTIALACLLALVFGSANAANYYGQPLAFGNSSSTEASHIIKTSGGVMYGLTVTNGASAGYVLMFDATTVPSDGAVNPVGCYAIPAGPITVAIPQIAYPRPFVNGIVVVFSSTGCFAKTASSTAWFSWQTL